MASSLPAGATWTPLYDSLVQHYGLQTAAVFGIVWRYCQMRDGVCKASLDSIAQRIGTSRRSVIRHLGVLEQSGHIKDLTPNLRNRPHIYVLPTLPKHEEPVQMHPTPEFPNSDLPDSDSPDHQSSSRGVPKIHTSDEVGVPNSHTAVPNVDTRCAKMSHPGVPESHMSNTSLRDIKDTDLEEISPELKKIWSALLMYFSGELNKANFMTWLYPCQPLTWDGSTLTILAPNDYAAAWLNSRLKKLSENFLKGSIPHPAPSVLFTGSPV